MYAIVPTIEWCEDGTAKVDFMLVIDAFAIDGAHWILSDSLVAEASEKGLSVRVWIEKGECFYVAVAGDSLIPRGEGEEIGIAKVFNACHFQGGAAMNATQFFGQMRDDERAIVRLLIKCPPSGYAQFRVQTLHAKLLERGGAFEQLALSKGFEELYWAISGGE